MVYVTFTDGQLLTILGPDWFPFRHKYIVQGKSRFWTPKSTMPATETRLRLAEYHGRERARLDVTKSTGKSVLFVENSKSYIALPVTILELE